MADQVEIQIPKFIVNERSQFVATAYFRTRASAAAEYKIYNLSTQEIITDWTTVTPAANVSITVKATENLIKADYHRMERYELLVAADRGLATEVLGRALYRVRNLGGHTE